jgi:4-hydroxybenzoate polyprenyltransferase
MTAPRDAGQAGQEPVHPRIPEGQIIRGNSLLLSYFNFVKLPHTLFALPFALLGVVAASWRAPVRGRTLVFTVAAFASARWVAMGFNRIADLRFDRLNPRNRYRELPRGRLTVGQAWASVLVAAVLFVLASAALNPLCGRLAPVALGWVMAYSFAKRFTWACHLWLGVGLAMAPVGGYLAIAGHWSQPWWALPAVAVAVATWVAGFDIFYALPDERFDREQGLRSAVVRFGVAGAIRTARLLHATTIPALVLFGIAIGFGVWYYAGVAAAAVILVLEHRLVHPDDLSRVDAAFFLMNAVMSVTVFAFALIDRVS